jgi:hypothetical protein
MRHATVSTIVRIFWQIVRGRHAGSEDCFDALARAESGWRVPSLPSRYLARAVAITINREVMPD